MVDGITIFQVFYHTLVIVVIVVAVIVAALYTPCIFGGFLTLFFLCINILDLYYIFFCFFFYVLAGNVID